MTLSERVKKLMEFDEAHMGPSNRQHRWRNEGAQHERSRTAELEAALCEMVETFEAYACAYCTGTNTAYPHCLCYRSCEALSKLTKICERMETK